MTSPIEYEASQCQLEQNPPEIRLYNDNIREKRWTHVSLEGVKGFYWEAMAQRS